METVKSRIFNDGNTDDRDRGRSRVASPIITVVVMVVVMMFATAGNSFKFVLCQNLHDKTPFFKVLKKKTRLYCVYMSVSVRV